jgi:hypothetical protein
MFKGTQIDLLGMPRTPDGQMTAGGGRLIETLDAARAAGARVTVRVTGGNANFQNNGDRTFYIAKWKQAFDAVSSIDVSSYVADGTLIGHYAIDEPYSDFDNLKNGSLGTTLEQMCQYQKSFPGWRSVPCLVREINTRLRTYMPAGGYKYLDAGWSQLTDHQYVPPTTYDGDIGAYYRTNLAKGREAGLGMMYGFNIVNGGREFTGCAKPYDPNDHNCAMTAAEIRAMADTIAAIGANQGCGVLGYEIDAAAGPVRDYFFSTGTYSSNGIQNAMQYLNSKVGAWQSGSCNIRGDLPAP